MVAQASRLCCVERFFSRTGETPVPRFERVAGLLRLIRSRGELPVAPVQNVDDWPQPHAGLWKILCQFVECFGTKHFFPKRAVPQGFADFVLPLPGEPALYRRGETCLFAMGQ